MVDSRTDSLRRLADWVDEMASHSGSGVNRSANVDFIIPPSSPMGQPPTTATMLGGSESK